jgi:hypothetical protein
MNYDANFQVLMADFVHIVFLWALTTCSWQTDTGVSKDLAVSFLELKQFSPEAA